MRIFGLEPGNYILIATGKTAEYGPELSITGTQDIKVINQFYISNWDDGIGYYGGRGCAKTKFCTLCLKEQTTLTFSVVANRDLTNQNGTLNAIGRLSIYQFK